MGIAERIKRSNIGSRSTEETPAVILQLIPRLALGGLERDAVDIAGAAARAGATSLIATEGGPLLNDVFRSGAKPVELPFEDGFFGRARYTRRLAKLLRRYRVDIVHAHDPATARAALAVAERTGALVVTTCGSAYPGVPGPGRRQTEILLQGDRVIVLSEFTSSFVRVQRPEVVERLRLVERGVDFTRFDPERVPAERVVRLLQQWRLPDGAPIVMHIGRFAPEKGQETMLDAVARLNRKDIACVMVGYDAGHEGYREAVEERAEALGFGARAHVTDDCRDLPAAYMLADVVVVAPAVPGASGRVVREAQAMGRPVVAIDHGGWRRLVEGGQMTWLVPPGDPAALTQAIAQALALTATTRARLAPLAAANMALSGSKEAMLLATLAVYGELLQASEPVHAARAAPASDAALTTT